MISSSDQDFFNTIKAEITKGLPGETVQNLLSPVPDHAKYRIAPEGHKVAAVMALLYPIDGRLHLGFIERTSLHPDDKHAGQISFPGGKLDEEDNSLLDCAIREVEEEIGIPRQRIKVLGALTKLYVYVSNFMVYPFVGYLDHEPKFILQKAEVASLISYPLENLLKEKSIHFKDIHVRGYTLKDTPYFPLYDHTLWGATAMISNELIDLVRRSKMLP